MKLTVKIEGVPPKKDGANSMWRKSAEVPRLKRLRVAVLSKLTGQAPHATSVHLTLRVYAPVSAGDLDNFVTGICDGLMAAHENTRAYISSKDWQDVPERARPDRDILYASDSCVSRIEAERMPSDGRDTYELEVEVI